MKYTEAGLGRTFILRLEHHDRIPDVIEDFAKTHKIRSAAVLFLGGADEGSKIVTGPEDGKAEKPKPTVTKLKGASEAAGVGTLFLNESGIPKLHLHASFGRQSETVTGCTRQGVSVWHIGEVIIIELINTAAVRKIDGHTGFELLETE